VRSSYRILVCLVIMPLAWVPTDAIADVIRDPTRPYSAPESFQPAQPEFKVNAIIVSSKRQIAIINGKRVGVGEQVNGATVVSIAKKELVLDVGGRQITLQLNNGKRRQ